MVRMGRDPKRWSQRAARESKKSTYKKPSKSSLTLQVGRVSPNVISSIYTPVLLDLAIKNSENYAATLIPNDTDDNGIGDNSNVEQQQEQSGAYLFTNQESIDEFTEMLRETSSEFTSNDWKVRANAAKFERKLDEKYGFFLPFIKKYPQTETYIRTFQRRLHSGEFHPLRRGDGPLSTSSSVILLFMLHRNGVRQDLLLFLGLFLIVGLQPLALVLIVSCGKFYLDARSRRRPEGFPKRMPRVTAFYSDEEDALAKLSRPVGTAFEANSDDTKEVYDVIVIGCGLAALYTSALLTRAGRKTLLLCIEEDACGVVTYSGFPFDIHNVRLTNLRSGYIQSLLAPALASVTDPQGGVRFKAIGGESTGYAHTILEFDSEEDPFVLRSGGVASDATMLYNNAGLPNEFHGLCQALHASAPDYFFPKMVAGTMVKQSGNSGDDYYGEVAARSSKLVLEKMFGDNELLSRLYGGIGSIGEDLSMDKLSFGMLLSQVANSEHMVHYPIGGSRAMGHAFANVIEKSGGKILTGVKLTELLFEEYEAPTSDADKKAKNKQPRCIGVKATGGKFLLNDNGSLVSHMGFLGTFYNLFPEKLRTSFGVPTKLWTLTERRPHFKILLALKGTADELELPSCDYKRCPYLNEDDANSSTRDKRGNNTRQKKFFSGHSYLHITFPSAKDPTWSRRYPNTSIAVVTIEADDDFVRLVDTQPKIYMKQKYNEEAKHGLLKKVIKDVQGVFPTLECKIKESILYGPLSMGLSHIPERFSAPGINCGPFFNNLYMGGKDLTMDTSVADLVGGWMAVNSVLGYNYIDYKYLERNVTKDVESFLGYPYDGEEEEAFPMEGEPEAKEEGRNKKED